MVTNNRFQNGYFSSGFFLPDICPDAMNIEGNQGV